MNAHTTNNQQKFIIRHPTEDDASRIIEYSKIIFTSTDQVLTTLEEYTITEEEEKNWITSFNQNPNALLQVAELSGEIVGLLFFAANTKRKNLHTGEFGVNVHPHFQGLGIGRALVETLLQWAETNRQIEKVTLCVLATNTNAIKLYNRLGFIEEGRQVKAIKQTNGDYVDVIQMYIETK